MRIEELLGTTFEKLRDNNKERIEYIDEILGKESRVNKEMINTMLFKVFESELEHTVFHNMIKKSTQEEREKYYDYNPRVLMVVREEYKRSKGEYYRTNTELCTYRLTATKEAPLPYRAMLRAFKFKRKWQDEIILPNLKKGQQLFVYNADSDGGVEKNITDFFSLMGKIGIRRNKSVYKYKCLGKRKTDEMMSNIVFLLKALHSSIKEAKV